MALLPPLFNAEFRTDAGAVAAGYLLDTFDSGTTTPKTTYTNQAGSAANANPIVLDAAGRCALWLGSGEYTLRLRTPGGVTVWTRDDVAGVPEATAGSFLPLAGGTMTGAIVLPGNATSALQAVPKQQLDNAITALSATLTTLINTTAAAAVPVGTLALWLTGTPPSGWLHLNGQAVSRTTYATLFALWGTTFGSGDGATTFNLPDLRGEFPRFWDASRGVDPGRAIGTAQAAAVESHKHIIVPLGNGDSLNRYFYGSSDITPTQISQLETNSGAGAVSSASLTSAYGGSETRPRNVSLMAIVKAT